MTILWDITLDGNSIGKRISNQLSIRMAQSEVHNSITFDSTDHDLFLLCDPSINKGQERLVFHIGSRKHRFLLEDRQGSEIDFTIWGRSLSALDEREFRSNIQYVYSTPRSAKDTVEAMLNTTVSWGIIDWVLPENFTFNGVPVAGAQQIVQSVGGILRADDSGNITVRYKWDTRPIDIENIAPVATYDRKDTLIVVSAKELQGSGEGSVTVTGRTGDIPKPLLEVEESDPVIGNDVHVRAFWGNTPAPDSVDTYVTDGNVQDLGSVVGTYTDEVTFVEGVGSLPRPIHSYSSITWKGTSAAPITYTAGDSEIFSSNLWGVAEITYTSVYHRYRLYGHSADKIIMALGLSGVVDSSITVKLPAGSSNEAKPIIDNLLTSDAAKVQRGTAFLDDNYYDMKNITVEAPYNEAVSDGSIVSVLDVDADVSGNFYVTTTEVVCSGPAVTNVLEMSQIL